MGSMNIKQVFQVVFLLGWSHVTTTEGPIKVDLADADWTEEQVAEILMQVLSENLNSIQGLALEIHITPPNGASDTFSNLVLDTAEQATFKLFPDLQLKLSIGVAGSLEDGSSATLILRIFVQETEQEISTSESGFTEFDS